MKEKLITEWCGHCGNEVEIPGDKPSLCPGEIDIDDDGEEVICGEEILPCSACQDRNTKCDWSPESGCSMYPKENEQ